MGRNRLEALGAAIATARHARGWSMEELAIEAGLTRGSVFHIERGASPNAANLIAIAAALGVTVGSLLGEDTGETAALERALPGWSRLTGNQQARIRETVADLAAAHPLEVTNAAATVPPEQLEAARQSRAFQQRADRLRAAEDSGTYQAGATGDDKAKPAAPRRRGSGQASQR